VATDDVGGIRLSYARSVTAQAETVSNGFTSATRYGALTTHGSFDEGARSS